MNGFHLVTFRTQRGKEFTRKVFVEEDFHEFWSADDWFTAADITKGKLPIRNLVG